MTQPKKKRGPQFRTRIMNKRYILLLAHHGRSTAKQLQPHTTETEMTTVRRLRKLYDDGLICSELVGCSREFWTIDKLINDELMQHIRYGRAEVKSTVFITPTSTRVIDEIDSRT